MSKEEPNFSRSGRRKGRNRSNQLLNMLIGVVVLLIIIVAASIFLSDDSDEKDSASKVETSDLATNDDDKTEDGSDNEIEENNAVDENADQSENQSDSNENEGSGKTEDPATNKGTEKDDSEENSEDNTDNPGTVTYVPSEDDVIAETVIDTSWQPIGTVQTGEHTSLYDGESVDWEEKKQALAYATGLPHDSMIFWKIKNGGGPQKSVGVVSSRDSEKKYRVYLEWVDEQGWKPVKMDVLNTLDFEY
jgi:hypothetical protein